MRSKQIVREMAHRKRIRDDWKDLRITPSFVKFAFHEAYERYKKEHELDDLMAKLPKLPD